MALITEPQADEEQMLGSTPHLLVSRSSPRGRPGRMVEVKPRYDNFIGERWIAPVKGQYMANVSPVNGKPFCEVARSTVEDVELALDAAHAAKDAWATHR